jgi:hypothetical protein
MEQKTQLDLDNLSVETKNVRSIMQEINELPESQRKDWINKAVTDLKANGMFNAIIQKRAQESKISNGILGGKVVSIYAEEIYGPMWRTQQEILKAEEN